MVAGDDGSRGRIPSRVAVAIVLLLLAATAAAFVYTERQKLTRGLVTRPTATHFFSPACACETATAAVSFRLADARTATVRVQRENGRTVRTLASREPFPAGTVRLEWDGRTESGEVAREGSYGVVIDFAGRRGKRGKLRWDAPPGTYELTIAALDLAGNVGPPSTPSVVVVQP